MRQATAGTHRAGFFAARPCSTTQPSIRCSSTLIGNGPDVMTKVTMVGSDLKFTDGGWTCGKNGQSVPVGMGTPTVKVSEITVGGTRVRGTGSGE